jgi:signal recognition particle subunit SEC65
MEKIVKTFQELVIEYVEKFDITYPILYLQQYSEEEQKEMIIKALQNNKPIKIKLIENVII